MRATDDFNRTVRGGVRAGRQTLVVHLSNTHPDSRVGFVVSKQVGNAVTRNRVKRQLRHLMADRITDLPGMQVVVRALPAAVGSTALACDLDSALRAGRSKLAASEGSR